MAGVYIHIPFCKSRCGYCDFFSTTLLEKRTDYIDALLEEWKERRTNIDDSIQTLYFGGGTPSLLPADAIARLVDSIATPDTQEITLEANPGDLNPTYLAAIRHAGVNRLSIGIQSFNDALLKTIGRRHNAQQAIDAVQLAKEIGFDNLSIDLIYGIPGETIELWKQDVEKVLTLGVQHLSTYCLSYEEQTPLTKMLERGEIEETDEELENRMYDYLCLQASKAGFVHYEVSNFALVGYESQHNSSYWNQTPYIGLGPGAHSFDGKKRSWNIADLDHYLAHKADKQWERGEEELSQIDQYNEYILLGLRTNKGVNYAKLSNPVVADKYIARGLLSRQGEQIVATQKGLHILNKIIEDLMI